MGTYYWSRCGLGRGRQKRKNWDNYNSINNKILKIKKTGVITPKKPPKNRMLGFFPL